jgi:hypothetical protein
VDRRKQGLKRSVAVEASGMPLAALPAPAKHRDVRLLAAILDVNGLVGLLPVRPVVHVDAGYDWELCRQALADRGMAGQIAARVVPAPVEAGRRWVIECTHAWATSTASCTGAPSAGEATPVASICRAPRGRAGLPSGSGLEEVEQVGVELVLWVANAPWGNGSRPVADCGRLLDERVSRGWTRPSGCPRGQ